MINWNYTFHHVKDPRKVNISNLKSQNESRGKNFKPFSQYITFNEYLYDPYYYVLEVRHFKFGQKCKSKFNVIWKAISEKLHALGTIQK